ncbi:solute carrier family 5 (sodium/glucose cotransporter), member 1 [Mytilus galloprovincialis]|uniref:Solute carrier family 5 (Sodium/glucose cotransporter), member 1 n=1 Tax=Mytilus galloprovincialis TaxID=29158 RepID=A0A8B6HP98_MYTGA|nr:solute carrier family 5 (sodium/glucose cotransporter), member 1 [Mytilus galloprovincialis]
MAVDDVDTTLHWGDILVVIGYFIAVIIVGILSSCRNRGSVKGYFLAGRSMHWIPVGASLFASNIGSGHFVGLAGSGAASGIGIAVFELNAIFILMVLGWFFVPVYTAAGVFTMPEYLKKRFGGQRIRVYLSVLALLLYVFTKLSADLFSGAIFITQSFKDLNLYVAVIILLAISAVFTIAGGLTAVIWTDFIQVIIMIIGAFIMMILSFIEVGGYEAMIQKYFASFPDTTINNMGNSSYKYAKCGIPPDNAMHLFRSADDGSLPWPGIMFGLTISAVWYWCSDQVIVQRALAAKNLSHAKAGTILAGYLKFLPLWIMVFPGMISRILYRDSVGCADPDVCEEACGSRAGCSNIAFPKLVLGIMPTGLKGLMLAVMMSALISSLTSIFNSSSTLFTIDIWLRIRKQASDVELMIVGRCCVLILVVVSIVWIPIIQNISELFHYIQAITSFLAPPVCAIYVLAVFWKRTNEQGAFWGLMIGLVVGLTRFIWEYAYTVPPCGEEADDNRPDIISKVHYLHFGIILFGISFIATIIISLLTKPIPDKHLHRLTFWNRYSTEEREDLDAEPDRSSHHETKLDQFAEEDFDSLPCYTRAFRWICGIEKMEQAPHLSEEEKKAIEAKQNSIHETKTWRYILNINAVVLMTLAVFLWGFYA